MKRLVRHVKHILLFIVVWAIFLSGCSSWEAVREPPEVTRSSHVRLIMKNGDVLEVKRAYARNDTLFGYGVRVETGLAAKGAEHWDVPKAVPLESIAQIQTRQTDAAETVLGVVVGVVVVAAVALVAVGLNIGS